MRALRLRPDVRLWVEYADDSPLGTPASSKLDASLASLFAPIEEAAQVHGVPHVVERAGPFLSDLRERLLGAGVLQRGVHRGAELSIAPAILYPDPTRARPVAVTLLSGDGTEAARLTFDVTPLADLHDLVARLQGDDLALDHNPGLVGGDLLGELARRGLLVPAESCTELSREPAFWQSADATFVGHNTVVVRSARTRILVDPWLLPRARRYPAGYQPVARAELGAIDAIVLTHSHPDHFVPDTLLQFDRSVPIVVPRVERESLLAVDMARRLGELGFADIRTVGWWEELRIGDVDIAALPFFGEQPTTGAQLCPEVRNAGNTYLIRTPRFACALIADSGRDRDGDVRDVALRAFRR